MSGTGFGNESVGEGRGELQFYQQAQLRRLLEQVRALAAQKRLEAIFDVELFAFSRNVEAVLAAPTRETGDAALREGRQLLAQLQAAPDKSSSDLLLR